MNSDRIRKRIVFGINNFVVGGAQYQLIRQLKYFDTEKYAFHVITLYDESSKKNIYSLIPDHVDVHLIHFKSFADVRSWFKLFKLLQKIKPNLILSSLFFSNTVFRLLGFMQGFNVIAREHNTYINKSKGQIFVDWLLSHITPKIIAVSQEVADFTSRQEHIAKEKFKVINNGIDLKEIEDKLRDIDEQKVRRELGIEEKRIALHVGRLVRQKNQELLIKSFAEFHKKHPEWILLIVGGGGRYPILKKLIDGMGISNAVLLIGEQENVHPYYAISDCYISTSRIEGMSNTHLEALAHGLPIISTKTGGTGSLVRDGENGLLIPEATEMAVKTTLEKFIKGDIGAMASRSKELSREFDIKKTAAEYEAIFNRYAR